MDTQFAQPNKIVAVQTNKQAIARALGTKASEVAYLNNTNPVDSYNILYEKATQTCWYRGNATGTPTLWAVSNDGKELSLTTTTGSYTLQIAHTITTGNIPEYLKDFGAEEIMLDLATYGKVRSLISKLSEQISVKDFLAKGDGVTDDSAAIQAAVDYGSEQGITIFFPAGTYLCNTPISMTGRVTLQGENRRSIINGVFNYTELAFPTSADANVINQYSPFFFMSGLVFVYESKTIYTLNVTAQAGHSFLDCMEIHNCQFFGNLPFLATNIISAQISHCWFYSYYTGILGQGCTNWTISNCWFRNQRRAAIYITHNTSALGRSGGENFRIVGCEFAVCAKGIYAFRHVWMTVDSCLFDYNTLPVELHGSYYVKVSNSYMGAANQGSLSNGEGFVSPPTRGVAMYAHPAPADSNYPGASYAGGTFVNCEFVNYIAGSNMPVAYVEGFLSPSVNYVVQNIAFIGCKFISGFVSTMTTMLSISYAENSLVQGCAFYSPNVNTNLNSPYVASNCKIHHGIGNFNHQCTINDTPVPMPYDYQTSAGLLGIPGIGVWLKTTTGDNKLGVNSQGTAALVNATVGAVTGTFTSSGYVVVNINGGDVEIPYRGRT